MAESIFPEKRTRSQITLPDNILQVADASPMKLARTALKNQRLDTRSSSRTPVSDSEEEDELLLSPNKKPNLRRKESRSKRSASPPPQDEYNIASHSPLDGRELKRAKRDSSHVAESSDTFVAPPQNPKILQLQSTTPRHNRTSSEPNVPTVRRSNRKRSATTSKPPPSTASASPPRTLATPPQSPGKGRAQSVPLFTTGSELPRVDFRNLPPSPKRARSRSRSPSKERESLRIISGPSIPPLRLPTIEDNENTANMDIDEASSVSEEIELPYVDPATMQVEPPHSITLPAEAAPETPRASSVIPPLPQPITTIPFTPVTQSLNKFIPLSPLTPLPETPWVGKVNAASLTEGMEGRIGWGLRDKTQEQVQVCDQNITQHRHPLKSFKPPTTTATNMRIQPTLDSMATSKSRLPRPPMAPPAPPPSKLRQISTVPAPSIRPQASTSKTPAAPSQRQNAFDVLMGKKSQADRKNMVGQKPLLKGKATQPSFKPSQPSIFSNSKGKEKAVTPESGPKLTMKAKMKARSNVKDEKLVITVDEDEQDDTEAAPNGDGDEKIIGEGDMLSKPEVDGNKEVEVAEGDSEHPSLGVGATQPEQVHEPQEVAITAGPEHDPVQESIDPTAKIGGPESNPNDVPTEENAIKPSAPELSSMVESTSNVAEPIDAPAEPQSEQEAGLATEEGIPQVAAEPELPPAQTEEPSNAAQINVLPKVSKLAPGKKRVPSAPSVPPRVTRSVSKQKDAPGPPSVQKPPPSTAAKRKPVVVAKKEIAKSTPKPVETPTKESVTLPPGSPMKVTTPGKPLRTTKSFERLAGPSTSPIRPPRAKTPVNLKTLPKPLSTPSPAKIARSTTALTSKPSGKPFQYSFFGSSI